MIFVSLIAVSAVSAADNVSDVVSISDVDEPTIAVENEAEPIATADYEAKLMASADNEAEPIAASEESDVLKGGTSFNFGNGTNFDISSLLNGSSISFGNGSTMDLSSFLNGTTISFGNGTSFGGGSMSFGNGTSMSFGNGTSFDLSKLLNGTGISFGNGSSMSFGNGTSFSFGNGSGFDIGNILSMLGGSTTKKDSIEGSDLTKYYTKTTTYKVTVKNGNEAVTSGYAVFTINNEEHIGHIGSDGVASINLNALKPGTYYVTVEYGQTMVKHTITIKKAIITKNVSKKYRKAGKFTVKILNSEGKVYAKQTVKIKFNGKTYAKKTNSKGIATLKLPKNLKVGKYTIKTTYAGMSVTNKITVKK